MNTNTNSYNPYGYDGYNLKVQDEDQYREDFREEDLVQDYRKKEDEQEEVERNVKDISLNQHVLDHGIHSIHPHLHHGVSSKDLEIFEDKNAHIEELNDDVNEEVLEVEAEVVNDEGKKSNRENYEDEDKESRPYENYIG